MKKTVQKVKQPKQSNFPPRREPNNPLDNEWDAFDGDDSDIVSFKHFYESDPDHRYF